MGRISGTLREGFTTGSCAAAAALAACLWLRDGECPDKVEIVLPEGRSFSPSIIPHEEGCCGVRKDSGDDPDATDGCEVIAAVRIFKEDGEVRFLAGEGVGTITQPGLKIPVGEPAINPVPRRMIKEAVRSVFGGRSAEVTIIIPGGKELAERTFNPRLGIRDGLSILGTSGVVRPMSEEALRLSLREELHMRKAKGEIDLIYTFGNQGEERMRELYPGRPVVQVGNELGFMLDEAAELSFRSILLGGHPGKLVKVAAGIMQTHSKYADGRREAVITQLALMGAPASLCRDVYQCVTVEAAVPLIRAAGYEAVWGRIEEAAKCYCELRVRGKLEIQVVCIFS